MWEADRYNWRELSSETSAAGVPHAFDKIRKASNEEEASNAYWQIELQSFCIASVGKGTYC